MLNYEMFCENHQNLAGDLEIRNDNHCFLFEWRICTLENKIL